MGVFSNALPFALLTWGQEQVTSGFAGITMAVVPLLVLPLAHVFVPGERMTPRKAAGFVVGFAGVAVLVGPVGGGGPARSGSRASPASPPPAATPSARSSPGSRRRAPPSPSAPPGCWSRAAISVPLALWSSRAWPARAAAAGAARRPLPRHLPDALATVMLVYVVQSAGPSFMSLVNYQVPVWAVILGLSSSARSCRRSSSARSR